MVPQILTAAAIAAALSLSSAMLTEPAAAVTLPPYAAGKKIWGLDYDPQIVQSNASNYCGFTRESVLSDLLQISTVTDRLRVYTIKDCDFGSMLLDHAQATGLKVWFGLWISNDGGVSIAAEIAALRSLIANSKSNAQMRALVEGVVVGSETLFRGDTTATAVRPIPSLLHMRSYLFSPPFFSPLVVNTLFPDRCRSPFFSMCALLTRLCYSLRKTSEM